MKTPSQTPCRAQGGFSLVKLVVVTICVTVPLLALLLIFGQGGCGHFSPASSTEKRMAAIRLGLENYKTDFGEFPEPAHPGDTIIVDGKPYDVSGATMLYQALRGDGFDQIKLNVAPKSKASSDGAIEGLELRQEKFSDMPKEMWVAQQGRYYLVDGFGKPFQYTRAASPDATPPANTSPPPATINRYSYDLWSYGPDNKNTRARSIETTTNKAVQAASEKWIKNW